MILICLLNDVKKDLHPNLWKCKVMILFPGQDLSTGGCIALIDMTSRMSGS